MSELIYWAMLNWLVVLFVGLYHETGILHLYDGEETLLDKLFMTLSITLVFIPIAIIALLQLLYYNYKK